MLKRRTIFAMILIFVFVGNSSTMLAFANGTTNSGESAIQSSYTIDAEGAITQELLDEINSQMDFDNNTQTYSNTLETSSINNQVEQVGSNYVTQELLDEINSDLNLDNYVNERSAQLNNDVITAVQKPRDSVFMTETTAELNNDLLSLENAALTAPVLSLAGVDDYFVSVTWTQAVYSGGDAQILYDVYLNGLLYDTTSYTSYGGISVGFDTAFSIYVKAYLQDDTTVFADSNTVSDETLEADPPDLKPIILDDPVVSGTSITINWHEDTTSTAEYADYFAMIIIADGEYEDIVYPSSNSYTYTNLQTDVYYDFTILSGYSYYGYINSSSKSVPFYNGNNTFLTKPVLDDVSVDDYFVNLEWTPAIPVCSNDQVEYEIFVDGYPCSTVSYTDSSVGVGHEMPYSIYVEAYIVGDINKTISSNTVTGCTLEANPPDLKPVIIDPPTINNGNITINWHEDTTSTLTSADYFAVVVLKDDVYEETISASDTSVTYTDLETDVYYKFIILSGYRYYGYIESTGEAVPFYNGNADFLTLPVISSSVTGRYVQLDWTDAVSTHQGTVYYEVFMNDTSKGVVDESCMNNIAVSPGGQHSFYVVASISVDGVNKTITSDAISIDPSLIGVADSLVIDTILGEHISVVISAVNLPLNDTGTVALKYDSTKLGLADLCLLTYTKELSPCTIADMGITIVSVDTEDGEIVFASPNLYNGNTSKLLNALEFVGLVSNEQTTITIE